jgi:hypothetical protein
MLAPIREESFEPLTPCPPGATDVRLYRVSITNTRAGLHLLKGRLGP